MDANQRQIFQEGAEIAEQKQGREDPLCVPRRSPEKSSWAFFGYGLAALSLYVALPAGAAPAEKPPIQHAMMGVQNGCFVETVAFLDRWKETNGDESWARLLQWGAREDEEVVMGHAVAICDSRGALWCWDSNFGWAKLQVDAAQREDVTLVAAPVLRRYPRVTARFPTYRFDFGQTPKGEAPAAQLTATNTAVRDASIVAAQLAKKRPVNAVRFSYGPDEAKKESAAAIFMFHGRYCIYMPDVGTVPFRVRGDVANIRLIQDLLRRGFPGVTGVTKL